MGTRPPRGTAGRLRRPLCPRPTPACPDAQSDCRRPDHGHRAAVAAVLCQRRQRPFSDTLPTLFIGGGVLGVALLVLLGWRLWWLQKRIRRGVFGAKLTLKLLLMFGVVAMLPGLVVYGASVFFLNRSIETWFDVRVDNALTSGVNLGQAALDDLLRELDKKAQRMALTLSDEGIGSTITSLSTLREQSAVQELTLFDERGGVIAHVSGERGTLLPVLPERSVLWQVRQQQPYSRIEEVAERGLIMRVIVPVYTSALAGETRVLQLVQPVPASPGARRAGGAAGVPGIPADRGVAAGAEAHLRRGADADPDAGAADDPRHRLSAVGAPWRAAALAGARHPRRGQGRFLADAVGEEPRRAGRADPVVQPHDAPAVRGARTGCAEPSADRAGQGLSGARAGQPVVRRGGARRSAAGAHREQRGRADSRGGGSPRSTRTRLPNWASRTRHCTRLEPRLRRVLPSTKANGRNRSTMRVTAAASRCCCAAPACRPESSAATCWCSTT